MGIFNIFRTIVALCICVNNVLSMNQDICQVLSFSGGGSFGAVEVGILSEIKLKEYDMITGVSAGGLNAGFLSYYNYPNSKLLDGIENLANIYFGLNNSDVYEHNTIQLYKTWSYYDTTPLKKTIDRELSKLNYFGSRPTLIGSTNLNLGGFQIFKFEKESKKKQVDILMATSAIPLVFPPIIIDSNYYVDGGVIANEIISGIDSYIKCNKYNITFITSSTKINQINSIDSFEQYIKRIGQVVLTDFNNELSEIIQNPCGELKSKGRINYCYPISDKLDDYSMLDFSHGKELYDIGKTNYKCDTYNYC